MEAAFRAIADPSRRAILDLLAEGRRTVTDLLRHFRFSQPAISKHLRILREAGLVESEPIGRARWYALRADGLRSVAGWLRHYEQFWNTKLDALGGVLSEKPDKRK
jgi:DNA-binding transcriptional ArsR family regulator